MLTPNQILQLFKDNEGELRRVFYLCYGESTGWTKWQHMHEAYTQGDAKRIAKDINQLWLDADDTASYLQDSVWDLVRQLAFHDIEPLPSLDELLTLHKDSVVVGSEPLHNDERDHCLSCEYGVCEIHKPE